MSTAGTGAKQRQILEAARQLFLERGFDGASTDAITERARVSKETLYRYYRSKEELLVAVMREMTVEQIVPPITSTPLPVLTAHDLEAALVRIVEVVLDRLMDPAYLALCRLTFGEGARHPELVELFRRSVPEAGSQALRAFLEDARQRGLLRADLDVAVATRLLVSPVLSWGLLDGLMAGAQPHRRPPPEVLRQLVRLFLEGTAAR
jgi:AcrR family transcriptional regulator